MRPKKQLNNVAPFTGAWIETCSSGISGLRYNVAPFTGAWIETRDGKKGSKIVSSLPSRERGLKQYRISKNRPAKKVAPFTGAWIETLDYGGIGIGYGVAPFTGAWIETLNKNNT